RRIPKPDRVKVQGGVCHCSLTLRLPVKFLGGAVCGVRFVSSVRRHKKMAQWLGQFTGATHSTRVEDAERTLRNAVKAFLSSPLETERQKAVHRLAERVLRARLQFLKAALASARRIPTAEA